MHPLSTFPSLLDFGLISPLILRLAVAVYFLFVARIKYKHKSPLSAGVFTIIGILIFVGLYTQVASFLAIIILSFDMYQNKKKFGLNLEQKMIFIFVTIITFSLLFTGPGFLAFDLPL